MIFTDAEYAYLVEHPLGRLATIGPGGAPHLHPVAFRLSPGTATIDIGGPAFARSQKYRNVRADPRVSFVVDDESKEPNPFGQRGRGIEIRGRAAIVSLDQPLMVFFDDEIFRLQPRRIVAWNIDEPGYNSRNVH
ncbi:PPOX class F420-dependent oxidoreductase [Nonomuraea sp. M3C6]|uniref:PPOX class F420-dependent oxidoreductase n=1 Tax=Nonomuraea marmarensis TaxID=3351344 RepID=A0ABW7ALD9_9ACTN